MTGIAWAEEVVGWVGQSRTGVVDPEELPDEDIMEPEELPDEVVVEPEELPDEEESPDEEEEAPEEEPPEAAASDFEAVALEGPGALERQLLTSSSSQIERPDRALGELIIGGA
jgi:hypothetical protein